MGSKKSFLIAVAVVGVAAVACVNGDATEGQAEEALTNAGLDDAPANCVAGRLANEANLSQEQLNDVAAANELDDLADQDVEGTNERLDLYVASILEECVADPDAAEEDDPAAEDEPSTDTPEGEGEGEGDNTTTTEAPE